MAMGPQRWLTITESPFPWEREALEFLRGHLPDRDPWYAWSNVEFIDDEGKVNEVDALVLSPHGLFLVEIKSRPGRLDGDAHSWTWTTDGRRRTDDNPLILANRKAKRLKGLLQRQSVVTRLKLRLPYVSAVIFLSADGLDWQVDPSTALSTFGRRPSRSGDGIINALNNGLQTARPHPPITAEQANMVRRAIADAGIRPSLRDRRIGDYELKRILAEGDGWQDWEGRHVTLDVSRRIRLYPYSSASDEEARRALGRMAVREFQVLEGIDHPGLLRVRDYRDTERGPALIFDHDPRAIRLDLLMRDHLDLMGAELRLHIVRQLAETLKYAHGKRLFHRALSPHSILVRDVDQPLPRLQIMNWQTAAREASAAGTTHATTGTSHLDSYVEDPAKVYIAPEALSGGPQSGPHHDVFSLAAIAYHLFTGQPPAPSPLELAARLRSGSGLLVSDVVDGAMQSLVDLIRIGTHPEVPMRIASMDEFLERLAEVERDLQRGTPETTVDPSSAKPGERLEGGFTVVRRLGRGASADALLVQPDGEEGELVLKVALDPAHNDRLEAEAAALGKLHHTNIVSARRTLTVAGRTAILMESAGPQTLAQLLRAPGGLSLDLKRRFGEELLSAVDHLEQKGVAHRDIKPDNIGITEGKERRRLVLFDFSLARTSPNNIQAGTRPYLDPFLVLRRPPRWDLSAERFAAAVTLHEMMTGLLPSWGDGQSDAAMIDDEATIASDRIDPHLREGLTAFFDKALRRTPSERFDNAEDMQRAWRRVFDEAVTAQADPDGFDAIARRVTAVTPIADLGYSVEAQDVLDRMGVHSVRDLLEVPRRNIRLASGVGDRIRKEIRLKAKRLAQLRQDLAPGTPAPTDLGPADTDRPSIDRLAEMLIPRRPLGEETTEDQVLAVFLGLEATGTPQEWPSVGEVASRCGIARTAVAAALAKGRERWQRQKALNTLRTDLRALLKLHGGVMTVAELTPQVLAMRGSAKLDEAERLQLAGAVLRAAIETEGALEEPQFLLYGADSMPLVAEAAELAQHARTLGQAADRLAALDPLAPPQRVHEELEALGWPVLEREDAAPRPTLARLRALAVAASSHAALSSKGEIYPRGMVPDRTLRLAAGSLLGPRMLTEEQLRERVRGRYPDAAPLPARPALDGLLEQAGIGRIWREHGIGPDAGDNEPGYYADTASPGHSSGYSSIHRLMTEGPAVDETPDVLAARQLEEKFAYARRTGGFLALTVDPRHYREAERALVERFPLKRLSLDRLMLDAMRAEADGRKVDWSLVLRADAADPQSRDWGNLQRLIGFAMPKIEQALLTAGEPVLLTDCGLFARYGLMDRLQLLRDASGTAGGPPGLWLLLPLPDGGLPTIGGKAVPVIDGSQWARLSVTWIENAHRAGSRPAA